MLVLDTDHLVEYQRGTSAESHRLKGRLERAAEPFGTTIITVEEIMRGWMAAVRRIHDPRAQIRGWEAWRTAHISKMRPCSTTVPFFHLS